MQYPGQVNVHDKTVIDLANRLVRGISAHADHDSPVMSLNPVFRAA